MAPTGCRIWINDAEVDSSGKLTLDKRTIKTSYLPETGVVKLNGLKPGSYRIVVSKPDFRANMQDVEIFADRPNVFSVVLTPLPAKLTVSPSIGGAEVELFNLDSGTFAGRYSQLSQIELSPGRYRVTASKIGYQPSTREVTLHAGESTYLESVLESLPTPTPTPTPAPRISNIPMSLDVRKQDKYLILRLQGSSGDSSKTIGSINVSLGGPAKNYVTGNLNGLPCQVEFIKLENIAEGSVVEAPGPSNQWSVLVVRIRPKDDKRRPISFSINWNSLQTSGPFGSNSAANILVPAEAIQRVQPVFPPEARNNPVSGAVSVLIIIDSSGSVVSAKAIDGPYVFRRVSEDAARKWKFRPATRDGRNVESEQTILFKFER
jgi:TonB family protein